MNKILEKILFCVPVLGRVLKERKAFMTHFPPGDSRSPFIDPEYILRNHSRIFDWNKRLADIDLNEKEQLQLLETFVGFYNKLDFPVNKSDTHLYYLENQMFSYADGLMLACMMNHFRPKRIIESGSGFSSALMLEMNHKYFQNEVELNFIEPYPDILRRILPKEMAEKNLIEKEIQEVNVDFFKKLDQNDFLFLDSTHIVKTGGDVNYWLFEIFPVLKPGVIIHIHDIFYPFEYAEKWVFDRKAYTEAYFIRAFLMNNSRYKIILFNSWIHSFQQEWLKKNMPLFAKGGGGSLWLMKL